MKKGSNIRKRSQMAGFTAIGMLGMLSGCGSADEAASGAKAPKGETHSSYVYRSVAQCVSEGSFSKAKCDEGYAAALAEQKASDKTFSSKQECEAEYGEGHCETRGGSRFGGFMAGYFIARSLDGSKYSYSGMYHNRKSGGLVSGSNSWLNNGKPSKYAIATNDFARKTSAAQPNAREKSRLAIAARGGFGSRASGPSASSASAGKGG